MKIATNMRPNKVSGEKNSGESIVESAGYMSAKTRIENMIMAGHVLNDWRQAMYDFYDESEDDGESMDPLREPGVDLVDIQRERDNALERLKTSEKADEKAACIGGGDAKQAAADAAATESSPSNGDAHVG